MYVRFTAPGNGSFEDAARSNADGSGVGIIDPEEAARYGYEEIDKETYKREHAAIILANVPPDRAPEPEPVKPLTPEEIAELRALIRPVR